MNGSSARSGSLMAMASMVCVQFGIVASVGLMDRIGAEGAAWLRLVWAGAILLVVVRPRPGMFTRSSFLASAGLGVSTGAVTLLFMASVARLPLGTASALEFLGPLGVAVVRGSGEGAGDGAGARRGGSVLAALGVLCLTEPWRGGIDPVGVGFALAAAACWAAYIVLTQKVGDQVDGLAGLAVSMPVAGLLATVVVGPAVIPRMTWGLLLGGVALALLLPVVPFALELLALRRLTAGAFGTLMCLEPACALVMGLVGLGQVPGPLAVVGVGCVVVAGIGAERGGARADVVADPVQTLAATA
jgi:inner membrane transporter RhtA